MDGGACDGHVPLVLELCREIEGPFGILYVQIISMNGVGEGRYQDPGPVEFGELAEFLNKFRTFIEQDGRHNLWVLSRNGDDQLIVDRHNIIYAYGDLDRYEEYLGAAGFRLGVVGIPSPHAHHYNHEFDPDHEELMAYWQRQKFPLEPGDDN